MRISKRKTGLLMVLFQTQGLLWGWAQIPVEISTGHSGYYYQHAFAAKFNPAKPTGFFHTSSVLIPYDNKRGNEIMSQSYVSYALSRRWTSGIGSIFTPLDRVRPSAFLQYFKKGKNSSLLVFPRVDIWSDPNLELMGFVEYRAAGSQRTKIYARLQYMTTWNRKEHVRSYQYARAGIDQSGIQFGLAANLDQYGRIVKNHSNFGLFVRKEL